MRKEEQCLWCLWSNNTNLTNHRQGFWEHYDNGNWHFVRDSPRVLECCNLSPMECCRSLQTHWTPFAQSLSHKPSWIRHGNKISGISWLLIDWHKTTTYFSVIFKFCIDQSETRKSSRWPSLSCNFHRTPLPVGTRRWWYSWYGTWCHSCGRMS